MTEHGVRMPSPAMQWWIARAVSAVGAIAVGAFAALLVLHVVMPPQAVCP